MKAPLSHKKIAGAVLTLLTLFLWANALPNASHAATFDNFNDYLKSVGLQNNPSNPNQQKLQERWEAARPSYMQYREGFINRGLITANQELSPGVAGMSMSQWLSLDTNPTARTYNIDSSATTTIAGQKQAGAKAKATVEAAGGCTSRNFEFNKCIWYPLVGVIGSTLIAISAWLLAISGVVFNWLVDNTIILYKTSVFQNVEPGVNVGWAAFRDLANIVIIGMFVYMAIMTILGNKDYGYKKLLATILIIAVLINFSLLFTKMIIDASNFTASELYARTHQQELEVAQREADVRTKGTGLVKTVSGFNFSEYATAGIASEFVRFLGVTSVADTSSALENGAAAQKSGWLVLFHALFATSLLVGAAFVLFYGSLILIYRAVSFIFLMLTSSIAFATHLHPKLSEGKYGPYGWDAWWKCLLGNAILAPLLMIFLYVTLKISEGINGALGGKGSLGRLASSGEVPLGVDIGAFFNYMIILALMFVSFKIAGGIAKKSCGECWNISFNVAKFLPNLAWSGVKAGGKIAMTALTKKPTAGAGAAAGGTPATGTVGAGTPRAMSPRGQAAAATRLTKAWPGTAPTARPAPGAPAAPVAALRRPPVRATAPAPGAPVALLRPTPRAVALRPVAAAAPPPPAVAPAATPGIGAAGRAGAAQIAGQNAAIDQARRQAAEQAVQQVTQAATQMAQAGQAMTETMRDSKDALRGFGQAVRSHTKTVQAHAKRIEQTAVSGGSTGENLSEIKTTLGQIRAKLHEGNATMRNLVAAVAAPGNSSTARAQQIRWRKS